MIAPTLMINLHAEVLPAPRCLMIMLSLNFLSTGFSRACTLRRAIWQARPCCSDRSLTCGYCEVRVTVYWLPHQALACSGAHGSEIKACKWLSLWTCEGCTGKPTRSSRLPRMLMRFTRAGLLGLQNMWYKATLPYMPVLQMLRSNKYVLPLRKCLAISAHYSICKQ